jgi:hypothetical protein
MEFEKYLPCRGNLTEAWARIFMCYGEHPPEYKQLKLGALFIYQEVGSKLACV